MGGGGLKGEEKGNFNGTILFMEMAIFFCLSSITAKPFLNILYLEKGPRTLMIAGK